jgi:hypothetical protein
MNIIIDNRISILNISPIKRLVKASNDLSKKVALDNAMKLFVAFLLIGSGAIIGAFGTLSYFISHSAMIRCEPNLSTVCPNYNLILANDVKIVVIGAIILIIGIILSASVPRRTSPEELKMAENKLFAVSISP